MSLGTTRMHADDPRPESVLGRRLARCRRPRRPQNAPSERPADGVGEGDVNHARPRQGHQRKLGGQAVRTNISLSQPRMPMDSSPELLPMRLRMTWKTRSGAAEPGSGGGRGARRHVGRARGRLRPPRRSTRNTWRGRATRRGRARCSWLSRLVHDRLCRRSLRVRQLGIGAIRRGLAQAFDLIGRLICRGGVRIGQTQLTILRLHMPWAGLQGVRAQRPTLCRFGPDLTHGHVRVGDLCLAVPGSHRESPGDPGGALQARWTVPTTRRREIPISGGTEGVN